MAQIFEKQTRKQVRELLLWGYAETLEVGETQGFVSGDTKIVIHCLSTGIFKVIYESIDPKSLGQRKIYKWTMQTNVWDSLVE